MRRRMGLRAERKTPSSLGRTTRTRGEHTRHAEKVGIRAGQAAECKGGIIKVQVADAVRRVLKGRGRRASDLLSTPGEKRFLRRIGIRPERGTKGTVGVGIAEGISRST